MEDSIIAVQEFGKEGVAVLDVSGGFCGYIAPDVSNQDYFAPLIQAIKKSRRFW
ncbi:MAG TPA: hypothetical protein VFD19_04925 [Clostridia bacterium]|nr:hypothetical protein [Clostridia bacterium]